jgi:hypothetical protein
LFDFTSYTQQQFAATRFLSFRVYNNDEFMMTVTTNYDRETKWPAKADFLRFHIEDELMKLSGPVISIHVWFSGEQ